MWRILVVSDSHGNNDNIFAAAEKAGNFNLMIHLGDVCTEYQQLVNAIGVPAYMIRGNCDYDSRLKTASIIELGGHRMYLTHGHMEQVQRGHGMLKQIAADRGCDIAMYGHTHIPYLKYPDDGDEYNVIVLNPGSVTFPRQDKFEKSFAIVEIDDEGRITCSLEHI